MTLIELREMCAKIAKNFADNAYNNSSQNMAMEIRDAIQAIQLPEQELVAFLWIMDNTDGIPTNNPFKTFSFNGKKNPFGTPGEDYSEEYPVTCTPLYAAPPSLNFSNPTVNDSLTVAALEKKVSTLKEEVLRLCDEVDIYKTYDDDAGVEVWVADLRELTELIELVKAKAPEFNESPWLPIETAPKTSKSILVYNSENKCTYIVTYYIDKYDGSEGWLIFGSNSNKFVSCFSHWMPLPPAPEGI